MLAVAFADNPLNRAVIRSDDHERRVRSNLYGMRAVLPTAAAWGCVWLARRNGSPTGALISTPPGRYPLPTPGPGTRLACLVGQGRRVSQRWAEVFRALDAVHVREPHWYLSSMGVRRELQGSGVGRTLLRDWLAEVDTTGAPAYLETDRSENIPFYEGGGFRVVRESVVIGVPIWHMIRRARDAMGDSGVLDLRRQNAR